MHQRALILALMAVGAVLPGTTRAADDCSQMFVYSVNQFCRTLSNGFSQCQPVGMVGPAPNCAKPGVPPIMPMPLAPPVLQAPAPFNYMAPFPAPGGAAPVAVQPIPAAAPLAAAKPVPAAKPERPVPAAAPIAAAPSAPVAVAPPAPVAVAPAAVPEPAPVVAVTPAPVVVAPAPKQEAVATPIAAPVPVASTPSAPAPAKVEAAAPAAVVPAPSVIVVVPATPPAQPAQTASAPAAAPVEPAMPPSITLQDGLAHFGFDRAELSGPSRAELDAWLKQPLPKGKTLRVTGHADRIGPASYNLKLSGRRAESVKKYLVGKGVAGQDIKVVAKGESEPVKHCKGGATKATIDCLAPNRRVEIDPE